MDAQTQSHTGKETLMTTRKPATIAVRTGIESDTQYHAVVPPIKDSKFTSNVVYRCVL